jgi:hypothetical protein
VTVFCLESVQILIKTNIIMKGSVSRLSLLLGACPFSITILTRVSCYARLNGLFNGGSGTGRALFNFVRYLYYKSEPVSSDGDSGKSRLHNWLPEQIPWYDSSRSPAQEIPFLSQLKAKSCCRAVRIHHGTPS